MTHDLGLTKKDYDFLAAQEKQTQMVGHSIELAHLESRMTRHLKEAEGIKAELMALHEDEAANCMETSLAAVEDSQAALR